MIDELYEWTRTDKNNLSALPKDTVVAMAYVPFQNAKTLYSPEQGICMGTLFPELSLPFDPENRMRGDGQ